MGVTGGWEVRAGQKGLPLSLRTPWKGGHICRGEGREGEGAGSSGSPWQVSGGGVTVTGRRGCVYSICGCVGVCVGGGGGGPGRGEQDRGASRGGAPGGGREGTPAASAGGSPVAGGRDEVRGEGEGDSIVGARWKGLSACLTRTNTRDSNTTRPQRGSRD